MTNHKMPFLERSVGFWKSVSDLTFLKNCEAVALAAPHRQDENGEGDSEVVRRSSTASFWKWCSTPKPVKDGVAFKDSCVSFTEGRGHDVS